MSDLIDLASVTILDAPDVRAWPATATITQIAVTPDNIHLTFTKESGPDAWPPQPFGDPKDGGNCQYTVWLFLQIDGRWYASGFINMWQGRDGVGDSISDFPANWYYDAARWAPMTAHHVLPGEMIGFMVTAGNARHRGASSVQERSNVVTIEAPFGDTGVFTFGPVPAPAPAPAPAPGPAPLPADLATLLEQVLTIGDALVAAVEGTNARLDALQAGGLKVHL